MDNKDHQRASQEVESKTELIPYLRLAYFGSPKHNHKQVARQVYPA